MRGITDQGESREQVLLLLMHAEYRLYRWELPGNIFLLTHQRGYFEADLLHPLFFYLDITGLDVSRLNLAALQKTIDFPVDLGAVTGEILYTGRTGLCAFGLP